MLVREAHVTYTVTRREDCQRRIRSSNDVARLARPWIAGKLREHFFVILLDQRNNYVGHELISIGTLDSAIVHPRDVFALAVREQAARIVVVHNHPSGDCRPSEEDKAITRRLVDAGRILGIEVLDHIIVSDNGECSLRDIGVL